MLAYFILLCFTFLHCASDCTFFLQIEGLRLPCTEQVKATFPKTFVHSVSLCHILVILTIFPAFSWLLFLLQWAVILDANTTTHSDSDSGTFNQSTFKLRYIHVFLDTVLLWHTWQNSERCKSHFYTHRETERFPRLSLLPVSLYSSVWDQTQGVPKVCL